MYRHPDRVKVQVPEGLEKPNYEEIEAGFLAVPAS